MRGFEHHVDEDRHVAVEPAPYSDVIAQEMYRWQE
jgi:hypothetical protein